MSQTFFCIKVNGKFQKSGNYVYGYKTINEAIKMVDICYGVNSLLNDVDVDVLSYSDMSELQQKGIRTIIKDS